jgi:phosphatidylglycerophosphatase A
MLAALLQPLRDFWSAWVSRQPADHAPGPPVGGAPRRILALALATAGGVGYAPIAPGTFGSMVGVAVYWVVVPFGPLAVAFAAALASGLGVWAAGEVERIYAKKDDGRIVIDEVAGQLITLLPLAALAGPDRMRAPLPLLIGFLVFRGFDIAKPGPVRWAERRFPGGQGVMYDDILAGVLSAGVMALLFLLLGTGA